MATKFWYFGFEYEILEDKKNEVALVDGSNARGKTFIPKEVDYEGEKYTVTQITGSVRDKWVWVEYDDKRKKPKQEKRNQYFGAFESMNSTLELIIPNTVTAIGDRAFSYCSGLSSITIPNSVTSIGKAAFWGCKGLTKVNISDLAAWCAISFRHIDNNPFLYANHLYLNEVEITDLILPNNITSIGKAAFRGCTGLRSVTIPSSVNSIDEAAFADGWPRLMNIETVTIENEEGEVIIHPNAFPSRAKIVYVGKPKTKLTTNNSSQPKPTELTTTPAATIDLEKLIAAALVDGVVTEKEREILCKKVKAAGGDVDEFELLLDARIYEAQQKNAKVTPAKPAPAPKSASQPEQKAAPKPAQQTTVAANSNASKWSLTPNTTIADMRKQFKDACGAQVKIYNGNKVAEPTATLAQLGLTAAKDIPFSTSMKVAAFIEQMKNLCGLKVKVYTCDEWVAALDDLTLESVGKVKKNATKADMEKML